MVRDPSHPGEHHGVLDLEHVGQAGAHGRASYWPCCARRGPSPPRGDERGDGPRPGEAHAARPAWLGCWAQGTEGAFPLCVVAVNAAGRSSAGAKAPSRSRKWRCHRPGVSTTARGSSSKSQRAKLRRVQCGACPRCGWRRERRCDSRGPCRARPTCGDRRRAHGARLARSPRRRRRSRRFPSRGSPPRRGRR